MIHSLLHHLPALARLALAARDWIGATGLAWGALYLIDRRFNR